MDGICSKCGQVSNYKQGDKGGKPWAGYFCTDKDNCKNVDWVKLQQNAPKPEVVKPAVVKPEPAPSKTGAKDTDMMRLSYRKDLMIKCIEAGMTEHFESLWSIIEG